MDGESLPQSMVHSYCKKKVSLAVIHCKVVANFQCREYTRLNFADKS